MQSDRIYVSVGIVGLSHVRARQCTSTPSLQNSWVFGSRNAWFHAPMFLSADTMNILHQRTRLSSPSHIHKPSALLGNKMNQNTAQNTELTMTKIIQYGFTKWTAYLSSNASAICFGKKYTESEWYSKWPLFRTLWNNFTPAFARQTDHLMVSKSCILAQQYAKMHYLKYDATEKLWPECDINNK